MKKFILGICAISLFAVVSFAYANQTSATKIPKKSTSWQAEACLALVGEVYKPGIRCIYGANGRCKSSKPCTPLMDIGTKTGGAESFFTTQELEEWPGVDFMSNQDFVDYMILNEWFEE